MNQAGVTGMRIPINLALGKGAYTARLRMGSQRVPVDVMLDTGSATFVLKTIRYNPDQDRSLKATSLVQDVVYGSGAWAGPTVKTDVEIDHGNTSLLIRDAPTGIIEMDAENTFAADGILGLAYHVLNHAYDLSSYLKGKGCDPPVTYPWCFGEEDGVADIRKFRDWLKKQPRREVEPLLGLANMEGLVSNQFSLLTHRCVVHVGKSVDVHDIFCDPLNQGVLVFGGGDAHTDLYRGQFQGIRILHDKYYNTNLKTVCVEGIEPITVPACTTQPSNSFVDSGSSFIVLANALYEQVIDCLNRINPEFGQLISSFNEAFKTQKGVPVDSLKLDQWPSISFTLEGAEGEDVTLSVAPEVYWQTNALLHGQAFFMFMDGLSSFPDQSILGLPVLNGRFCVFDRSYHHLGEIRIAAGVSPSNA